MDKICYTPVTGLDDVIASKVTGWNKYLVANLRGLYEEKNPESETPTAEELMEFRRSLSKEDADRLLDSISNPTVSYRQLRDEFSAEERFNRISMISTMFSDVVDAYQAENSSSSRKDIISQVTVPGIFNEVYDILQEQYSGYIEEGDTELVAKYQKIFDNWGALISFAKVRIKDIEDIRLGQRISFADNSNPNDFNDNNLAEKFVMEESKKEGWMGQVEFESSFGSVGKQVRKVIGRIPVYDKGEMVMDDLGFPVMQEPVKIHQELLDILRGVSSEAEMMSTLREYSNILGWVEPFLEELDNPQVRTQFYVDFKKNFQPYSIQTEKNEGGVKVYKTPIINRIKGEKSFKSFLTGVRMGNIVNPVRSIYNESGDVIPIRLQRIKNKIIDTLTQPTNNITEKPKFWKMSRAERKLFLIDATESLGIDVKGETIDRILTRSRDINKFNKELLDLANYGLVLRKEEQEGKSKIKYESLIKRASSNERKGVLREKISKLLEIISKFAEKYKLESRARYNGNTFFSNVIPSFMGDRFDKIESFVNHRDSDGLRTMLATTYLDSPYFMYEGKILNKWIEDLYNSNLSDEDSFAANFRYKRLLGSDDLDFENFTGKQQAINMLNEYFSERQISPNSNYAWYPVFILGDSAVQKYIKAKRYTSQEILDGMYNVYIQEKRRMELTKAANKKMAELGAKPLDNFSQKENEFTLLTFLNDKKYSSIIREGNLEQTVKNAIKAYMKDSVYKFKTNLTNLGVLEMSNNKYIHLSQEVRGDRTIDTVIADYYWNTKFATIQQLQMFTIDPAFYAGTKDLQKRYKEIHAPGTALSIEAIDPFSKTGERYSSDGIERAIYFDDINVNAENFDSEFMSAIAHHFGKDSNTYNMYKKNTLTDGQGYRTLESYRKVMGMAGKWNEDMENAYNQIQDLRAKIDRNENPLQEDIKALSDLSVIFQPIKPYLYSFENFNVDGANMLKIPVQHKYAEAVLIPELLPAGSKLRDIAYWMEDHVNPITKVREPIDMIGSTKVVKVGAFGSTNISNVDNESLTKALDAGYVHQLSYGDYRIQTNVPEHINSSQLFGTQVRKLIMSKVKKYGDYSSYISGNKVNLGGKYGKVKLNGVNLVRFYNSLISANIIESYHMFEDAISDVGKISDRLTQTTANNSRESKDNMLAYAINEDGDITVPLSEGGLEHDSSALLFSLFKKMVNKQSIRGGSAVQVSAMGIKGYEEDGGLRYVTDPNNPNNILYAECEIPWDLNYTDSSGTEHALDFNDWCNEDGTLKVDSKGNTLIEKKYPNILNILAYRIPTERSYSMINLKVKRFSHKMAGGTIKVPPQGTTIAGFDFDIDKLYFMRNEYRQRELSKEEIKDIWGRFYDTYPNIKDALSEAREEDTDSLDRLYKYWEKAVLPTSYQVAFNQFLEDEGIMKFEEYNFDKSPLDNTKASRNNMLINLIWQRLSDVETFKDRYTPGGFSNASRAAKVMRGLLFGNNVEVNHRDRTANLDKIIESIDSKSFVDPEPNYDPSDPMTMIIYNQQNNVAGKLIGIFANQNTNHAFASLMKSFFLKKPIEFAGKSYYDLLNNPDVDTGLTMAEFLAASVDAVKDPVLNFLNLNTITADAGAVLARLGFTTEDIGLLLNQPIIKDVCDYSLNNGISDTDAVIRNVLDKYVLDHEPNAVVPSTDFSRERLAYNIRYAATSDASERKYDEEFIEGQLHVIDLFKSVLEATNEVSQFVRNTKFTASNAVGSTFGDSYAQQMRMDKYILSFDNASTLKVGIEVADGIFVPMNNNRNSLDMDDQEYLESLIENPLAYEQAMYDMNRRAVIAMSNVFPYNNKTYKSVRSILAGLTKEEVLDADTINSIHSDLMVYMLSQQENSPFNSNFPVDYRGDIISSREYFTSIFPRDLYKTVSADPALKALPIFQYMQFQSEDDGSITMNIQDIGGLAPHQKDEIKESWADLLKDEKTKNIATDLFMYNFYKLGFTFSPLGFMNLAPVEVKLSLNIGNNYDGSPKPYTDFLRDVHKGSMSINGIDFARQYLLNHLDNRKLVLKPSGRDKKIISSLVYENDEAADSFILDASKLGKDANSFLLPQDNRRNIKRFRPIIVIDDLVYMCNSGEEEFNISEGAMTYYRVEPLGDSVNSLQYVNSSSAPVKRKVEIKGVAGSTATEPVVTGTSYENITVRELIMEAADLAVQLDNTLIADGVIEALREASREDLIDTIVAMKEDLNKMKDQQGNKIC